MSYLKALLRFKGALGGSTLVIVLIAKLLGFDITEEQAGDFIKAVEEGGWTLVAFIAGAVYHRAKQEEDES